jgi:hypothetical protein
MPLVSEREIANWNPQEVSSSTEALHITFAVVPHIMSFKKTFNSENK